MTDPLDDTQPHPAAEPAPNPAAPGPAAAPAAVPGEPAVDPGRPLRVDPGRPSDPNWREPAWFPTRDDRGRGGERRSGSFAIVVGLILIAIGAWSFLETTLGIDLPRIRWSSLWPLILIVIGGLILIRSLQRRP